MPQISARVIADTKSPFTDSRITSMQLVGMRYTQAEFLTHRNFSRSASSSRAIPTMLRIKQVWSDPAMPVHWGRNQSGMQAHEELKGIKLWLAKKLWRVGAKLAAAVSYSMHKTGVHKQIANRITEPFQTIDVIVTSTSWDNFFELRCHEDAQPEIRYLAECMREALLASKPVVRPWHLPYLLNEEMEQVTYDNFDYWAKISSARNARVSYANHDGTNPEAAKDIGLFNRLVGSEPLHASPTEHVALVTSTNQVIRVECFNGTGTRKVFSIPYTNKNFGGFTQYRQIVETGWTQSIPMTSCGISRMKTISTPKQGFHSVCTSLGLIK